MIASFSAANHRLCSAFLLNFIVHHMHSAHAVAIQSDTTTHTLPLHSPQCILETGVPQDTHSKHCMSCSASTHVQIYL